MALQAFHHASVKLGQLSDLDDLLGFHQGKPQLRRGVRGDKVSPRRYEKTTYLQKANARPPQHRKVMGLQRAATGDGPRLLRTPDRQQPNTKKGVKATKIPARKISENFDRKILTHPSLFKESQTRHSVAPSDLLLAEGDTKWDAPWRHLRKGLTPSKAHRRQGGEQTRGR